MRSSSGPLRILLPPLLANVEDFVVFFRSTYTRSHLDVVADSIARISANAQSLDAGLKFVYEPEVLRFFQTRFAPVTSWYARNRHETYENTDGQLSDPTRDQVCGAAVVAFGCRTRTVGGASCG